MSNLSDIENKIFNLESLKKQVELWKSKNQKIVFTNGCFDILHKGHVTYLSKTADLGDKLIIAINTDASVKAQGKGDDRPINNEYDRAFLLAALSFTDAIVSFGADTPIETIKTLIPDVLVKGADYDENETDIFSKKYIVGSDIVKSNGGEVKTIEFVTGYSTSNIVNKIKK